MNIDRSVKFTCQMVIGTYSTKRKIMINIGVRIFRGILQSPPNATTTAFLLESVGRVAACPMTECNFQVFPTKTGKVNPYPVINTPRVEIISSVENCNC